MATTALDTPLSHATRTLTRLETIMIPSRFTLCLSVLLLGGCRSQSSDDTAESPGDDSSAEICNGVDDDGDLSLIHISEPTRLLSI